MGRYAHAENLLSQSIRFLVGPDEAETIIGEMEQTVRQHWYEIARREGLNEKECEAIRPAFAYDGFHLSVGR
jgi:serine/threonine-protein kinase HipA